MTNKQALGLLCAISTFITISANNDNHSEILSLKKITERAKHHQTINTQHAKQNPGHDEFYRTIERYIKCYFKSVAVVAKLQQNEDFLSPGWLSE
jgi:hypothetical protein